MTKGRGFHQPSALNLTQMALIQHFKNLTLHFPSNPKIRRKTKWQDSLQLLTKQHF
jgi:hypothetical protein